MIPKIIHFTWVDHNLPEAYKKVVDSWRLHHPDWQINIWSDEDNRALIEDHYPWFLEIYDAYPKAIMRCDAVRYFILHHEGGVYSDLDVECLGSIDGLMGASRLFLSAEPEKHLEERQASARGFPYLLCNALMGSERGNGFWNHVHEVLVKQRESYTVLDATGPFMLTGAVMTVADELRPDVLLADSWSPHDKHGNSCHDSAAYRQTMYAQFNCLDTVDKPLLNHLWHGSWSNKDLNRRPKRKSLKQIWRELRCPELDYKDIASAIVIDNQRLEQVTSHPRILIATPMKNAASNIERYREMIEALDYPCEQIDVAILYSDCIDKTEELLMQLKSSWSERFHSVWIERLDFGFHLKVKRWDRSVQLRRRSILAQCRNRLASRALEGYEYCLFIDVDLSDLPTDLIQQMLSSQRDVVMANCVKEDGKPFDKNAFLYEKLPDFKYLYRYARKEGLLQPPSGTPRIYLTELNYLNLVPLDCVGGTALLVKSEVLKQGVTFPESPYNYHIETEGFGLMARDRGFTVVGMPNLHVVHPSNE
ncbi:hypothetical protein BOW53_07665 [Solemya pervernicosa gill symbiont]|uniref:Glycosyl transferase n=2 Tax=Gammaproteobacteria incertae sedis TaxID=118884 RepID=A0A1T2L5T9_9GAMM|nr:glycosyltransferase [Candidatus Reidiella endopervernicosa]OOZ40443.1 hypothetical protein BOW53_07665 [Solemya pervernicosa gill symbiont]QKQ25357.1 hypothetical protein HUE57_02925 [Candidatus Reidiella endopervernicosa]